ncbi:hypothetical protein [Pedobacter sp. KBS0701]|uniref:hypothetical protein n=1 Tax=Pedobacter sp. KBS0701 TaxID=2578106 RepID=UPI00143CCE42|nr:hypothetical protein [Pedobacter sp. KBS0701]
MQSRLICTCDTIKLFSVTGKSEQATEVKPKQAVTAGAGNQSEDDDRGAVLIG